MKAARSVLLVHNEPEAFRGLEEVLHGQDLHTRRAHQCAEARNTLKESGPVDLVLTDVALPDGDWKHVIGMVHELAKDTPVIVMSRVVSMKLYLDTQDAGAADFIVPPMAPQDLAYTVTTAMHKKAGHRGKHPKSPARHDPPMRPLPH